MAKKYIDAAYQAALDSVEIAHQRIVALHYACEPILSDRHASTGAQKDCSALHAALFARLNEAYRHLFMWGGLVPTKKFRVAKRRALRHYLGQSMEIMSNLEIDGVTPSSYLCTDHDAFRAELDSVLAERKAKKAEKGEKEAK